jgi:hypothetical protein
MYVAGFRRRTDKTANQFNDFLVVHGGHFV